MFVSTSERIGTRGKNRFRFSYQHTLVCLKIVCRNHLFLQYTRSTVTKEYIPAVHMGDSIFLQFSHNRRTSTLGPRPSDFVFEQVYRKHFKTRPNVITGASVCPPTVDFSYMRVLHTAKGKTRTRRGILRYWVGLRYWFSLPCQRLTVSCLFECNG